MMAFGYLYVLQWRNKFLTILILGNMMNLGKQLFRNDIGRLLKQLYLHVLSIPVCTVLSVGEYLLCIGSYSDDNDCVRLGLCGNGVVVNVGDDVGYEFGWRPYVQYLLGPFLKSVSWGLDYTWRTWSEDQGQILNGRIGNWLEKKSSINPLHK